MTRNTYIYGLSASVVILVISNFFLPLLTAVTISTIGGYWFCKKNGMYGQGFNILSGLGGVSFIYHLFLMYPSDSIATLGSVGGVLAFLNLAFRIPGIGLRSVLISPKSQLISSALVGKDILGLATAILNGPALIAFGVTALAIVPLVLIDLAFSSMSEALESLLILFGVISLATVTIVVDTADKGLGFARKLGSKSKSDLTNHLDEEAGPYEFATEFYFELDQELPPLEESAWRFDDISKLDANEFWRAVASSFGRQVIEDQDLEFTSVPQITDADRIKVLRDSEANGDIALVSLRPGNLDDIEATSIVAWVVSRLSSVGYDADFAIIAVPTPVSEKVKLVLLAEYNIIVYDNSLLRRQFNRYPPAKPVEQINSVSDTGVDSAQETF